MASRDSAKQPKRSLIAFDLPRPWSQALRDVKQHYPDIRTPTALVRQAIQEFIGCHLTENEMKKRGLIPEYKSASKPELLLSALRKADLGRP
jgi:hypothetical protein